MPFDAASYIMGKNASGGGGSTITVDPLTVTENDTYTAPEGKAFTPVTVNVPNSYSASDEGKVVSNGSLVAQTSDTVTQNGTVDTTLINSLTVNVPTGGGGGVPSNDVNFIDYDGTIVYSYSAADFANLSALPANPSHSGLTAQGWNWTLADAKEYVASYGFLDIGQMYVTDDGKTRIYVHFEEGRSSPYLGLAVNGTVDIDWGDGSTHDTLTGTSVSTVVTARHAFQPGDYMITLTPASGTTFSFVGSSSVGSRILNKTSFGTGNESRVYQNAIQKVELGSGVTIIGTNAFQYCYTLASINIPSGVKTISSDAFYGCCALRSINIPSGVQTIGNNVFRNCSTLAIISFPYFNVTRIGSYMFQGCYHLVSINIPSKVNSISDNAFQNCYCLANINIPLSVVEILDGAFWFCYGLATLKFSSPTPVRVANSSAFSGVPTDCTIYVPQGSLSAYTSATNYPSSSTYTYVEY